MEPDTVSAVTMASWMEPTVLVALATGIIAILGVVVAFRALTKQEQQIRLLHEHDLASWMETFQAYRKQQLTPLAKTIRKAYSRFVGSQTGVPDKWEQAVALSPWPPGLPLPASEPLQGWKIKYGTELDAHGHYLLQFAESLYVPDGPGQSNELCDRTQHLSSEEYDTFDSARRGVADYFDASGMLAQKSDVFREFMDGRVEKNHAQIVKLVSYLEIALVRALPEGSQLGPGKPGLNWLGHRWFR